ncbi:MAG: hypothetical protein WCI74_10375, partial [Actinomycetes bacterium]
MAVDDETPPAAGQPKTAAAWRRVFAAPLLLAIIAQNIGNLFFHAIVGRVLPAADYGALGTVLSLMVLLTVPLGALQAAAGAEVAAHGWRWPNIRRGLWTSLGWGAAVGIVTLAATPVEIGYFHLASAFDAILLAPFVTISIVLAVVRGMLLGQRLVGATAITFLVSTAARLVAGLALLPSLGVTGALLGTVIGEACALAVAVVLAVRVPSSPAGHLFRLRLRPVIVSGVAIGGLFLFTTIDLFLARHFLNPTESGSYVAAATIAKTILALPAAVLSAAFPRMVSERNTPGWATELRRTTVVVVGLAMVGAVAVAAVPSLVLAVLYGPSAFPDAAVLVRWLSLVAGASSFVSVLTYAALSRRSAILLVPWGGAVLEVVLIQLAHNDALAIVRGSAIALITTAVVMFGVTWAANLRPARPQQIDATATNHP